MTDIPGRLDPSAPGKPTRPAGVCPECWVAWQRTADRPAAGYCAHHKVAWRVRASGRVRTFAASHIEFTDFLGTLKGGA